MLSGVLIFNTSAELVISRFYKADYSRVAAEAFRVKVVQAKNYGSPCLLLDKSSFLYVRKNDLIVCAMTKANANAMIVFQFLHALIGVFEGYFDSNFNEEKLRSNFVLVYELLDEVMDHGYPQIVDAKMLQGFIQNGKNTGKNSKQTLLEQAKHNSEIIAQMTGVTPWRPPQKKYHSAKNEVFLDTIEEVSVIISKEKKVLSSFVKGKIMMNSSLSGMPVARFGLNDMISMQKRREARGSSKKVNPKSGIDLEDVAFHQCVRLHRYEQDKTIMFIPPDGEFQLMTYRINKTKLPFEISSMVNERGRNRVEYHIKVMAKYEPFNVAQDIVINVPTPSNTAKANVKTTSGKCVYQATKHVLEWKIPTLSGGQSVTLKGDVKLLHLIEDKQWSRPPITMQFTIPMWPASGLKVRFLNVQETKLNYKSIKWVRYLTHAGDYQIRI